MAVKPIPDEYPSLQPYLVVDGAARLIEFLQATFEAEDSRQHADTRGQGRVADDTGDRTARP